MIKINKLPHFLGFFVGGLVIFSILSATFSHKEKYTVTTVNATYHTNTFRFYDKGIVFESEGKDVIVMGNFDITCKSED